MRSDARMKTELHRIMKLARAKKEEKVINVLHLLGNEQNLAECFHELKRGKASGVDGVTTEEYEADLEENLRGLIQRMKTWSYRPQPVQRVYIEKENGKKRALGIPTIEDKVVQMGIKEILEAVYEPEFLGCSYGFREGRGCHHALKALDKMIRYENVNYVIDADIRGFFDNVSHEWLVRFIEHRVGDKGLIRLIRRVLRSGVMEEGKFHAEETGTPQGGVVSPTFANIYLHYALDLWVEKIVKRRCNGYVGIVRYADDFVICVEKEEEAKKILGVLRKRLAKFGLELADEKTRLIKFRRKSDSSGTFTFLGFTHYTSNTRVVGRRTAKTRFARSLKALSDWLKSMIITPVKDWWSVLCMKVNGHYRYYGITGNARWLSLYAYRVRRLVKKWLERRSQRSRMGWAKLNAYFARFPLPKPRTYINLFLVEQREAIT